MPAESDGDELSTDLGSDSQTVLIQPKEDANSTETKAAEEAVPKSKMIGSGRKLA